MSGPHPVSSVPALIVGRKTPMWAACCVAALALGLAPGCDSDGDEGDGAPTTGFRVSVGDCGSAPAEGAPTASLLGRVTDQSGGVIGGAATVTVQVLGGARASGSLDGYGMFRACEVPAGTPVLVTVAFDPHQPWGLSGPVPLHKRVTLAAGEERFMPLQAKQASYQTLSSGMIAGGGTVSDGASQVTFQPDGLVTASGAPFTGDAQVRLTTFRADDPNDLRAFPGDFVGVDESAAVTETRIVSFGFVDVALMDADGAPLALAAGKPATLSFPVSGLPAGDTEVPLWWYDEVAGVWVREGSATVDPATGTAVGQVAHFTTWNADKPVDQTDCVVGTVTDASGVPFAGAIVEGLGHGSDLSGADGSWCVNFYPGATFTLDAFAFRDGAVFSTVPPAATFTGVGAGGASCLTPSTCAALPAPLVVAGEAIQTHCLQVSLGGPSGSTVASKGTLQIYDQTLNKRVFSATPGKTSVCLAVPAGHDFYVQADYFTAGERGETFCHPTVFNGAAFDGTSQLTLGSGGSCASGGCDTIQLECESHSF